MFLLLLSAKTINKQFFKKEEERIATIAFTSKWMKFCMHFPWGNCLIEFDFLLILDYWFSTEVPPMPLHLLSAPTFTSISMQIVLKKHWTGMELILLIIFERVSIKCLMVFHYIDLRSFLSNHWCHLMPQQGK